MSPLMSRLVVCLLSASTLLAAAIASNDGVQLLAAPSTVDSDLTVNLSIKCSVLNAMRNVEHVVSIVVERTPNGSSTSTVLAEVSTFTKAIKKTNEAFDTFGRVDGPRLSDNFLQLVWIHPNEEQAGQYMCIVNGVKNDGNTVSYTDVTNVQSRVPTIKDIVKHIRALETATDNCYMNVTSLQGRIKILEATTP